LPVARPQSKASSGSGLAEPIASLVRATLRHPGRAAIAERTPSSEIPEFFSGAAAVEAGME
jgi:hypothetical protein